jgi:hypothetical protein
MSDNDNLTKVVNKLKKIDFNNDKTLSKIGNVIRQRTLRRLIYVIIMIDYYYWKNAINNIHDHSCETISIDYIKNLLKCGTRTAYDFYNTILFIKKIQEESYRMLGNMIPLFRLMDLLNDGSITKEQFEKSKKSLMGDSK